MTVNTNPLTSSTLIKLSGVDLFIMNMLIIIDTNTSGEVTIICLGAAVSYIIVWSAYNCLLVEQCPLSLPIDRADHHARWTTERPLALSIHIITH